MDSPLPVFVHITKTGGTSVREALARSAGDRPFIDALLRLDAPVVGGRAVTILDSAVAEIAELRGLIEEHQHDLAYVVVNIGYGIHCLIERPVQYYSMMREPVDRCISYCHFTAARQPELWAEFAEFDHDPVRLFREFDVLTLSNAQTRMLTGTADIELGDEHLEEAKELIVDRYHFVGAQELFDESLALLGALLEWDDRSVPMENVTLRDRSDVVSRSMIDGFFELNRIDASLHDWLIKTYLPRRLCLPA